MPEQAKMTSREKEISEDKGQKRFNRGFFILGIVVSLIGYIFYDFHINHYSITQTGSKVLLRSEYPFQVIGLFLVIVGIIIISIGIVKKVYSRI